VTPGQSAESAADNPASMWDDYLWDRLLESISRERVIPILGPALSTVEQDGKEVTLDRFIAVPLAEQLGFPITDSLGLSEVVARYFHQYGTTDALYSRVNRILANSEIKPPPALSKIASIAHFKLFVTTSFDRLLEDALDLARFGGERRTRSLGFVPNNLVDCDELGSELSQLDKPIVYHLLGKVSPLPEEYVISDDDLVEYVHALYSGPRPEKLFHALKNNDLLLLGGNFSDWLVRLFLRLTKGQRLSNPRPRAALEILADEGTRGDPSLVTFLGNFSRSTRVFHANAPEFIEELTTRWTQRYGGKAAARKKEPAPIFLSYARQDEIAAAKLRDALTEKGCHVWFDTAKLKAGIDYDDEIQRAIKNCALFVPLLSKLADEDKRDAYFRREWHFAKERDTRNAENVSFILPVVVDNSSRSDFQTVPLRFLQKNILKAPGGELTEELAEAVTAALGSGG